MIGLSVSTALPHSRRRSGPASVLNPDGSLVPALPHAEFGAAWVTAAPYKLALPNSLRLGILPGSSATTRSSR
jgi:hypothetical protein